MELADPIEYLAGKNNVIEQILYMLDYKSLGRAECVSKLWNNTIKQGLAWKRLQKRQKNSDQNTFRHIVDYCPLPANQENEKSDENQDKKMFCHLLLHTQKLNNNWRFGKGEVREIDLSKWLNLENVYLMGEMDQEYISYLLAMDSKQIFIGFMTGNIMIFDRKTLQLLKEFCHGNSVGLRYLKMEKEYLLTATEQEFKISNKHSGEMLQVVVTRKEGVVSTNFGSGFGLFVRGNSIEKFLVDGSSELSVELSIWRLDHSKSASNNIAQLVHQTTFPSFSFIVGKTFVSENYVVTSFHRDTSVSTESKTINSQFQVRSNSHNFDLVYTVKEFESHIDPVAFHNDQLLYKLPEGELKLLDCKKCSVTDISFIKNPSLIARPTLDFYGMNSKFAIACMDLTLFRSGIYDVQAIWSQLPKKCINDKRSFLCYLPALKLGANLERSFNLGDLIMDEFSILQFYRTKNHAGKIACKIVLIDFLGASDDSGQEKVTLTPGTSSCSNCKQTGKELKRCSRCHGPRYCGIQCQKADWSRHKRNCVPP